MNKETPIIIVLASILTVVFSWSIYRIVYQFFTDILTSYGIESYYLQNIGIAVIALILLLIMGFSIKGIRKKVFSW
jgi:TRAP-type C4-dicarboxylate transport system permease small subunit